MLGRHKRKVTAVPVAPRQFAEDYVHTSADCCAALASSRHSSLSSSTDFSSPKRQTTLRVDELELSTAPRCRRQTHSVGSVFHLAKRLEPGHQYSSGTTDESSGFSGGVEVIISELDGGTVQSDVSDCSTVKGDFSSSGEEAGDCDFKTAICSVLERNRRQSELRNTERKTVLAQVRQQLRAPKSHLRSAVLSLIPDLSVRQEFLRAVDLISDDCVFLQWAHGHITGLYTLDRSVLFKLYGLAGSREVVSAGSVKRWLRVLDTQLVPARDRHEAVAFEC